MKKILSDIFKWIRVFTGLILVGLISITLIYALDSVFYNEEIDYGNSYKNLPKDSLDYIVLGSSNAEYSFVPSIVYERTGLYGYVLGTACQPLEVSYEMLKEACKTQNPRIVILEVFTALPLGKDCKDDSCYVIAENQMTGREKINTINYLPKEKAETYYIDFFTYHNDWRTKDFIHGIKLKKSTISPEGPSFGYIEYNCKFENQSNWWRPLYEIDSVYNVELDSKDEEFLNKIKDYCERNEISLLLYKAPIDGMDDENLSYLQKVWQWAERNNIKYIDFHKEAFDLDFYMVVHSISFHAYGTGASILSNYISDKLNEFNFSVNHKENQKISNLYDEHFQNMTINFLYYENDPIKYLKHLESGKGTIIFRYIASENRKLDSKFVAALQKIGLIDFDETKNTYAVIKDGELIDNNQEKIYCNLDNKIITADFSGLYVDNELINRNDVDCNLAYFNEDASSFVTKNISFDYEVVWDVDEYIYHRDW